MKIIFYYRANKTHFYKKDVVLGLILKSEGFLELGNGLLTYQKRWFDRNRCYYNNVRWRHIFFT